ncbi:MAG TPA: tetratricopeptide repeat protein [Pyrinomonadaceae bacterium]|nr:tetratricopeptide repeat protein [Pyrinomonadaceae bacterium]
MSSKSLTKSAMAVLGCAGAAIAAPFIAPYLATISLPFFGAVLAGVINNEEFKQTLGDAISNTAAGFMTEIGGHFATDKLPRALSPEHNFHLERMLATAYLNSLRAIEKELKSGEDEELKGQAAQTLPLLKARLERGLKDKEPSALFPLQTAGQPTDATFANRFSAEKVSLLIADEERWRKQIGEEVETALRRWLEEEREVKDRAARITQLSLARDTRLPEPLGSRLRAEMPHRIAHQISELVKSDDFKESWIAFQRAHLQAIVRVVERIETSQADIKASVDALAERIAGIAKQDDLIATLAGMQQEYLSQLSSSHDELTKLVERQSEELRGIVPQLSAKIEQSTERLSTEGKANTAQVSEKIGELGAKVDESADKVIGKLDETTEELKEILEGASRAARTRLKQLPAPSRDFTGRETELKELRQALLQGGVTISGVQGLGGVGKTALALKLAHEFKDRYTHAQIYLDLKGVSPQPLSPAEIMWHVVSSFQPDMKRPDDADLPAWYNSLLNDNRVLLFYDNARDAAQIAPLLPPDNCLLLVTSRKHFTLPEMFDKNLDEMAEADATKLLHRIAPHIGEHAPAIAEQCGYLPIALCAAASVLKVKRSLSPEDYLKRLRDRKARLTLHDETRDLTVEACFSLSYELLTEQMQQRWRTLAIFPTDFDAPAAAALWQTDVDAAKDSLAEFEQYSLLDWEASTRRYSLHDLARDFADTRLSAIEREHTGLLHAVHYLQILFTADKLYQKGGEAIAEGLSLFDNERVNIEAGQKWSAARFAENEHAAHLCNDYPDAGVYVLSLRQHPRDFIRWHEVGLSAARQLKDPAAEGRHLGNLGYAYDDLGEYRRAINFYEQILSIARESGNRLHEGTALGNLGVSYQNLGESRRAIEFYEQQLPITRETGDRRGEGNALANLGLAYTNFGETHRAIEFYEQALVIYHEIGDRRGEGTVLGNLGMAYAQSGDTRRGIEFYKQHRDIAQEIGDRRGEGTALANLGASYAVMDKPEIAIECMEAAVKIFEEIESPTANVVRGWLEKLRGKSV